LRGLWLKNSAYAGRRRNNWKTKLLGSEVPASMKRNSESPPISELERQLGSLQRDIRHLQFERELLKKANENREERPRRRCCSPSMMTNSAHSPGSAVNTRKTASTGFANDLATKLRRARAKALPEHLREVVRIGKSARGRNLFDAKGAVGQQSTGETQALLADEFSRC
jgi:hypothetical protein